jgi:hypothetical protein
LQRGPNLVERRGGVTCVLGPACSRRALHQCHYSAPENQRQESQFP